MVLAVGIPRGLVDLDFILRSIGNYQGILNIEWHNNISIKNIILAIIENSLEEIKTRLVTSVKFFIVVQVRGEGTLVERAVNEFSGSQNVKLREIDDI